MKLLAFPSCFAGKSSIIALIQGLYCPIKGAVLIDGVSLEEYDLDVFRSSIAVVEQDPKLFNISIRENVLYGLEEENAADQV